MSTEKTAAVVIATSLVITVAAHAATIVTQTSDRAILSTWLNNPGGQQSIAHQVILGEHDVVPVAVFDDESMSGADIVYISPSAGELTLTEAEMDALTAYAVAGGRVICYGDHTIFAEDIMPFAARFDVFYGKESVDGVFSATILVPANPLMDGPAGVVGDFNSASANDGLSSTNDDFELVARWTDGASTPAIGYLPIGKGEIIFMSDFNTFDNDMIDDHDNRILWSNLFATATVACPEDLDGSGAVDFGDLLEILANWGECEENGPCLQDLDGSGAVDFGDILVVLGSWGPCP